MEQRDDELDDLQDAMRRGTPYIHQPEERVQEGGACWINSNRVCGADCMAYDPDAPEGYEKCRVLGAAQRLIELQVTKPELPLPVDFTSSQLNEIIRGAKPPKV